MGGSTPVDDVIAGSPEQAAEHHGARSAHIRELVRSRPPTGSPPLASRIPKMIVQFWDDPLQLPGDVQECLDSWRPLLDSGFDRVLFDDGSARRFVTNMLGRRYARAFDRCHHPSMRCDYFRLCYLLVFGGFYVDADETYLGASCDDLFLDDMLKVQPMCYDVTCNSMVPNEMFADESQDSPEWIFYVNNNPLIAPPQHPLLKLALARSTRILLSGPGHPDIQSTTGPGNLTASLVRHSLSCQIAGRARDFALIESWDSISVSKWPLSYRADARNWRLWRPPE